MALRLITATAAIAFVAACSPDAKTIATNTPVQTSIQDIALQAQADTGRWYSQAQASEGKQLYGQYCAACHGPDAASTPQWRKPDDNGNYPPPPLNGTAHAWHHPLSVLDMVIRDGGQPLGGVMPAWGSVLSFQQRMSIVASFQTYWSDDIYSLWLEREQSSREDAQ